MSTFEERICGNCGCSDDYACRDEMTGMSCTWVESAGEPLCSFCSMANPGLAEQQFPNLERAGFVLP